ncbi:MAG: NAD-dependent epimerase/dehydratase family protein [Acidobacteriota bacterium]
MLRVLVTGAHGFIGRPVTRILWALGHDVRAWAAPAETLTRCTDPADVVIHLASGARHGPLAQEVSAAREGEVSAVTAVLDYCRRARARCLFASTAGVYRPAVTGPLKEDAPTSPESIYATSKLAAEERCGEASTQSGIECAVLRLFNVYGPGQRPPYVVPDIIGALVSGRTPILRSPEAVRDFVFVDDVAHAFVAAAIHPCGTFRVFNIGTGKGTRMADLVAMIAALLGISAEWVTPPDHLSAGAPYSVADTLRARVELGWEPATALEAGLAATCAAWPRTRGAV